MYKKWSILLAFVSTGIAAQTQSNPVDSAIAPQHKIAFTDTSINYDELFRDFDAFMDSILSPNSYFLASISLGNGYYNFETKSSALIKPSKKLTYSPTLGYYHKSGLGFTTTGYIVNDEKNLNFYQFSFTPSFDYLHNKSFATGISFTKFITRDSLPFYTTPLQNELFVYFTYRKTWLRPTLSMSYGWGSRTDYMKRATIIQDIRVLRRGFVYINTEESIRDFSIMASVRHDFYWLNVFTHNDHIRLSPQIALNSGTQKFGINQSSTTYSTSLRTNTNIIYNTENNYLDDQLKFQPLSLSLFLRGEYSIGRFFIQPQVALDYYFPESTHKLTGQFSVSAGFMF